jgi:two-component system response regulator FixJ
MSQQARDLFIRPGVKTTYAFHIKDETQGRVAREGFILAHADIIAAELPCDANFPQHYGTGGQMTQSAKIYLVDDDPAICDALGMVLENAGYNVLQLNAARDLLDVIDEQQRAVVILDHYLGDMSGLELQVELNDRGVECPVIFMLGSGDIALSVKAMKAGALDFLEKPVTNEALLDSLRIAFERIDELNETSDLRDIAQERCNNLSEREREVMAYIVSGMSNARIAGHLGLSVRTIEVHRSNINKKMGTSTLAELVRMADLCPDCKLKN